ncbi:MAG TPA: carotenoid oxygenase family protein [Acidimicrobiales bacterium]|nr:carotenoid oxygenase family protein [Acidimicrobiales bacterium]
MSKHTRAQDQSRRDLLRALGLGAGAIALGGPALLTGCSDDGATTTAGGTTGGTASTTTGPPASTASTVVPTPFDADRPYWVQGNFRPVSVEETITDLRVTGTIPSDLSGLFVRNGSNTKADTEPLHWFLGDGMVHGVRIADGKAQWYRNRYVQTPLAAAGKDILNMGGPPGQANNQSNVSVIHHAGKLLALGEVGWPFELDTADLATVGAWSYEGKLGETMTAHPKIDPDTGRMHFFGYEFLTPRLTYYAASADGALDVVSPIPVDHATMVHDFAVTDRDAIFWIGPVLFGADEANPYPAVPFHWDETGPCKVGVMPLDGSGDQIRWVDIDPCYVFHGLNAHREGDDVVVQGSKLPEAFGRRGDLVPPQLTEWRIGTGGTDLTIRESQLYDREMDLPTHDRRFTGRPTRHGWLATTFGPESEYGFELGGLAHVDLDKGTEDVWDPGANLRAGEGFFVPAGETAPEGEGWVLTYIWDRTTDTSSLAIFDAQAVAEGPVAQVHLGVRVPFGFHGWWVDESLL